VAGGVLNCDGSYGFYWVSWRDVNNIKFGIGQSVDDQTLATFNDPEPYEINSLSLASGSGNHAYWMFDKFSGKTLT
jgi:hypothetical protein